MKLYREWLIKHSPESSNWSEELIPIGRGKYLKAGLKFSVPTGHNWRVMVDEFDDQYEENDAAVHKVLAATMARVQHATMCVLNCGLAKKKRTKAVEAGTQKTYRSLKDAFAGPEVEGWHGAAELEFMTLTEMGVFDHGYSMEQLIELGYKDPINLIVQMDNKYINGVFERHKVHMAVAGHTYNLKKGVDYAEVFTAAPSQNAMHAMQGMPVGTNLH